MLTQEEIQQYRDRIFAATDHYDLEIVVVKLMRKYGDHEYAAAVFQEGATFLSVALGANDHTLRGLLFCCEAQYCLLGGEDQHGG